MANVDIRRIDGTSAGSVELADAVFGIQPNVPVMHQVVTAQLAAARSGTQSTLTRAEVRGGGAKPWRQKGTGRARQGSIRAPHWAGGGVALGPKPRSYKQKVNKKMVQLALRSALSDRASEGRVAVVESWSFTAPSTKQAKTALAALGFEGKVLVVIGREEEVVYKSFRNLPDVQVLLAGELNPYDVLCNDWVVFTSSTLPTGAPTPAFERTADGTVANTIAPQVGLEQDADATPAPTAADANSIAPQVGLEEEQQ
jgi:large subunit ribosomal protein L4